MPAIQPSPNTRQSSRSCDLSPASHTNRTWCLVVRGLVYGEMGSVSDATFLILFYPGNGIGAEGVRSQATAFVARDLKAQGHTARDLTSAGFTMDDLKAAGFTISELRATGIAPLKAPVLSHRTDHPVITNPFAFTDDDDDGWPQRAKWSEEKKARGKPEAEAVETHDHLSPQKMILGDRLYSLVNHHQPQWAPKITGMLLEMEISEILHLIENPETLAEAIREATAILQQVGYNELNDVTIGYR